MNGVSICWRMGVPKAQIHGGVPGDSGRGGRVIGRADLSKKVGSSALEQKRGLAGRFEQRIDFDPRHDSAHWKILQVA